MKIFITGITGFVGSRVAAKLLESGQEVMGLVRKESDKLAMTEKGYRVILADIDNYEAYLKELVHCDAIFHGAAATRTSWQKKNQQFIQVVSDALAGSGKVLAMQGGTIVFGDTGNNIVAEQDAVYAPPPTLVERAVLEQNFLNLRNRDIRTCIFYGSLVYGAEGAAIPKILEAAAQRDGYAAFVGNGDKKWSAIHVDDWADLIAKGIQHSAPFGKYFACTELLSTFQMAVGIGQKLGLPTRSISIEELDDRWGIFSQPLAFSNQAFSGNLAKEHLGWKPKYRFGDS
ncbi:MAG: NAD-dependent epimerase/dehydratase family protein [Bacteroidota bacterium]